jgi:uncharacterized membrane protein
MSDAREELAENLVGGVSVAVVGVIAVSAYLNTGMTGLLAIVGFLLVIPLVAIFGEEIAGLVVGSDADPDDGAPESDALARLRQRYAAGEIDEVEFERRVERLLETETVEDAAATVPEGGTLAEERPSQAREETEEA